MFGVKKGKTPPNSIDSLIGAGTRIDGNVTFSGGLRVDGEVHGNISSESGEQGTVVISEKASVEGSIWVGHGVINCTVIGPVFAGESRGLLPSARVTGACASCQFAILPRPSIQGRLVHQTSVKAVELKLATSN